jgi:hypothetical protein
MLLTTFKQCGFYYQWIGSNRLDSGEPHSTATFANSHIRIHRATFGFAWNAQGMRMISRNTSLIPSPLTMPI